MPRPKSESPKRVVKHLKDGTSWEYFYDRTTGENVGKSLIDTANIAAKSGTVAALIFEYRASSRFKSRAPGTQEIYGRTLNYIRDLIGDKPVASVTANVIQVIKEELQDTPSKANQTLALLSILFKMAVKRGAVNVNPAANPGKMTMRPRTQVWSVEAEDRYMSEFRPSLKLAFALMLYTLQRLSDCLSMTTDNVVERGDRLYIVLNQAKTDALVSVPVHKRLDPLLRARLAEEKTRLIKGTDGTKRAVVSKLLVPSPKGYQWARRNASRAWDTDIAKADAAYRKLLVGQKVAPEDIDAEVGAHRKQRRDLRRTGIVRLAERGASTPQIAAISGHSIDYCQRIIDTYLPRRTEVALGGIEVWENNAPSVVMRQNVKGPKRQSPVSKTPLASGIPPIT